MKAAFLDKQTGPEGLRYGDSPQPAPGPNEVLVRVHATAVTPTELQWYPTFNTKEGRPRPFPIILSHEFSGTVAGLGEGVSTFKVGDAVFGMNDWFANGALAEYCVAPVNTLARKPDSVGHVAAAVTPISALTAWQGLFVRAGLEKGQRVLIHGAAGGVGVFAVQLAHWCGAEIIATASARNLNFVRELGADTVVDYKTQRFEDVAREVDVVFDTVGGETLERSWKVLKPGSRLVTIATQSGASNDPRTKAAFLLVEANGNQLVEITKIIVAGKLRPFVEAVYPLTQASEAFARAARGGMRGKIVLQVAD